MNTKKLNSSEETTAFGKEKILFWFLEHKKHLATVALILALITIWTAKFFIQSGKKDAAYFSARKAYMDWGKSQDEKDLLALQSILTKHPELRLSYESKIAKELLVSDKGQSAQSFAGNSLKRMQLSIPYHADFAQTTLLISEGKTDEALAKAIELKQKLFQENIFDSSNKEKTLLFGFNLFRIAFLYQSLEEKDSELKTLNEIKNYLGLSSSDENKLDPVISKQLMEYYSDQNLTLQEYIDYREQMLKK